MDINQKYALITGATSGIGYELAKLFAKDQYNLVIVARNTEELEKTSAELKQSGIEVVTIAKDLFNREAPMEIYNEIKSKNIRIDVLVNDAGQGQYGLFSETEIDRELEIIQLNIGATIALTKPFLKEMIARKDGKILNLSSIAGKTPGPYQAVYHGTKAFIQSFTEAIRSENKDNGITITALLPGATETDFFNKADMNDSKIVQDGSMSSAADVAKDGYEALMSGNDMVISGFKNKAMIGVTNLTPDHLVADMMKKQQEPVNKDK
ncbi:SDR family NAD(P)-dependent oxidoreductase [Mucilaginibacter sp.]|uniref:SDR family NAD(P)-dependent oxidoreductase n=1 Tax=Mucilaginibacter sp. TaxID=1882438 RepID=UPI003AFFC313